MPEYNNSRKPPGMGTTGLDQGWFGGGNQGQQGQAPMGNQGGGGQGVQHNPLSFLEILKQYTGANPAIGPGSGTMGGVQNTFDDLIAQLGLYDNAQYDPNVGQVSDNYSISPLSAGDVDPSLFQLPGLGGQVQNVDPNMFGADQFDAAGMLEQLLGQRGSSPQFGADSIGSMGSQLSAAVPQRETLDLLALLNQAGTNRQPEMTRWGDRPLPQFDYGSIL